jgi:hypothetical protein
VKKDEGITRQTFEKMEIGSKLDVLFDLVHTINSRAPQCRKEIEERCEEKTEECNSRFTTLESKQKISMIINTSASLVGGFIGGWSAVWASFKFSIFN